MARGCSDYPDYRIKWLCKSDLTPKLLSHYGIKASVKEIKFYSNRAIDGYVYTGGRGYVKRVNTYSISKLKDLFSRK